MIPLSNLTDIWRRNNPLITQYTFMKKQTNNLTRARPDYFLLNDNSTDLVKKVGIGRVCSLFDHRPISLSKVQKGRGFWRLNGDLLVDPKFIFGCNHVIRKTTLSYSE